MTHEDPWPDPIEAKRLQKEREEQLPDPLPGYGLGTGRLGEHGLGAGRLKHAGLGESHHSPEHGHVHHASDSLPGVHRADDAWHPSTKAQLVAPVPVAGAKTAAPAKIPPPLFTGPIEEPVKVNRRQVIGALGALGVLGVLIVLALRMGPGNGGQFEQLGQQLGQGPARSYKYVADGRKQLYWPNELKYVNPIPEADRLYIHDDNDLAGFTNYKAGQL